ncbi:hypothetical protein EYF80_044384 [Liparis tanakae]|uniref:Uncharacterized protein n=1 Tax=Liparis tanakae TaxID=230148 RepID=A0A4Z2FW00_9TELE|nr:hypothetical protein EYF80_044384 [Liparis tanakae]
MEAQSRRLTWRIGGRLLLGGEDGGLLVLGGPTWSWPRSLSAAQPCSGPRSRPVTQAWSGPPWALSRPGIHTCSWGRSRPGAQASGPRSLAELHPWSGGWGGSPPASGPCGHASFPASLGGSLAVGGAVDPGSAPLAGPPDDITEQLAVG